MDMPFAGDRHRPGKARIQDGATAFQLRTLEGMCN
jgi:hypothetical protein